MQAGEVVHPSPKETVRCIRSGAEGGAFVFELELAPGCKGPPMHSHDEGEETFEVLAGQVAVRTAGEVKILGPGDSLTLAPGEIHTFWNPSKTDVSRSRITHGARFERLIAQPSFLSMAVFMCKVDPGASRPASPLIRAVVRMIAGIASLLGKRPVLHS